MTALAALAAAGCKQQGRTWSPARSAEPFARPRLDLRELHVRDSTPLQKRAVVRKQGEGEREGQLGGLSSWVGGLSRG